MNYSIKYNDKNIDFASENKFVEWQIAEELNSLFKEYRKTYTVKNDAIFLDVSYFNILCNIYVENNFLLDGFINALNLPTFFNLTFSLGGSEARFNLTGRAYLFRRIHHYYANPNLTFDELDELAWNETNDLTAYLSEIKEKNSAVLKEFKSFIANFIFFLKDGASNELSSFKKVHKLLIDDFNFLHNGQLKSLAKYKLTIGSYFEEYSENRGRKDAFVAAGLFYAGTHIFINSHFKGSESGIELWKKRDIKRTFYHEVGHALDYLYYGESILKKPSKEKYSSRNNDYLKCVKSTYRRFKSIQPHLSNKVSKALSYFCVPAVSIVPSSFQHTDIDSENKIFHSLKSTMGNDIDNIFGEFISKPAKSFSYSIVAKNLKYDYSRLLEESWAESFALLFSWFRHSFTEYDRFILKSERSYERVLIQCLYPCMVYMLENIDWSKLNISKVVFLKKRKEIKKFIDYVDAMPVNNPTNGRTGRLLKENKSKHYLKFDHMLTRR